MGKRKAQTKTAQNTDSTKKAKVEEETKPEQTQVVKKNKKQKATKAKKTKQSSNINIEIEKNNKTEIETQNKKKNTKKAHKKNKNALQAKIEKTVSNQETQNKTEKRVDLIPPELAKNLNKRQRQGIIKKIKALIKIREARGEILNQDEINKLVKEIIEKKSDVSDDKAENGAGVVNKKQGKAQKKKKKQVKH